MNILFLVICGMGLVFFVYFLVACHCDASQTTARRSWVVKVPPETLATNFTVGRHDLGHLELQMAEYLSSHRPGTSGVNSAVVQRARRPN